MESEKKRVLYFVPEFPRISETFIEREVSNLIEWDRLNITVLSLAKANGNTSEKVLARTVYKRINLMDFLFGLGYFVSRPRQTLRSYQIVLKSIKKGFWTNSYFFLKSLGYTKIISDLRPDHIHVHFLSWPSTTAWISSTILGIPFSISAHARDVFVESELVSQKLKASKFISICNSYAYQKSLQLNEGGPDNSKIKLIYHGVDYKMFETEAKMPKWDVPAIFLGGTRLVEKKGLRYMIEASRILKDRGITHRVDLLGPGDQFNELTQMIERLNLRDTVFIHGDGQGTPFKEVLEYYKVADIFVLPSVETNAGDVDGVPTVVIEAAMAKLPIISTKAGGITDLIEDGVTGYIIEQRNPEAIADMVQKLLSDKLLAVKVAEKAYHKAIRMFDINTNIGQLERLLQ